MEYRGVNYGPYVDRRSVDATVVPQLDKLDEALACKVTDRDDAVKDGGGVVHRLTCGPLIGVSYVKVETNQVDSVLS